MGSPYVGEIRMFAGNFAPAGWAMCNGQTLAISQNETLFNLIGTTYGGDGQSTFNVPNLVGRCPIHFGTGPQGQSFTEGEMAGVEQVTLTTQQIPQHNHPFLASGDNAAQPGPDPSVLPGNSLQVQIYSQFPLATQMANNSLQPSGGSQPHENMMPYLCVNFIISLFGVFPSPN